MIVIGRYRASWFFLSGGIAHHDIAMAGWCHSSVCVVCALNQRMVMLLWCWWVVAQGKLLAGDPFMIASFKLFLSIRCLDVDKIDTASRDTRYSIFAKNKMTKKWHWFFSMIQRKILGFRAVSRLTCVHVEGNLSYTVKQSTTAARSHLYIYYRVLASNFANYSRTE